MKKLLLITSIVASMAAFNAANAASTGTITFTGELTGNTCDVNVNGSGTASATVTLPTIGTNQLTSATQTAGRTAFTLALTNCAGTLNTASAYFENGSTVDTNGRLKNVGGAATGVSLQLRDGSSSSQAVIIAGDSSQVINTSYVDTSSGSALLPYLVEYYADAATTAGTVNSSVVYSIQYK